jgi:hypothetical protein
VGAVLGICEEQVLSDPGLAQPEQWAAATKQEAEALLGAAATPGITQGRQTLGGQAAQCTEGYSPGAATLGSQRWTLAFRKAANKWAAVTKQEAEALLGGALQRLV